LALCEPGTISKVRHLVKVGDHIFEVDVFDGENQGLVVAEIELKEASEVFIRPDWLGEEVTGDVRYYNSMLSRHPYSTWENKK
jgi:adenylate cyclase